LLLLLLLLLPLLPFPTLRSGGTSRCGAGAGCVSLFGTTGIGTACVCSSAADGEFGAVVLGAASGGRW